MQFGSRALRSAVAITAVALLTGSVGGIGAARADSSGPILRIATAGFVDSFNPFTSIYLLPTNSIRYMYESLVQNSQEDGSPTKGLADHWETKQGGRQWVFTLQDGLKWSDDQPITSADVKYTYDQMMTVPELGEANGNLITNFASVETPDDKTVVINMKSPQAPNPGAEIPIVPKHVWEKIKKPADYPNDKNLVGSGPFVLTDYKASQRINLKANKNFWRGAPKIGGLQYIYYTNSDAQVQALRAGDVDFATQLSTTQFDALQNAQNVTTHEGHNRRYFSISINVGMETRDGKPFGNGNPALQDVNVRQAIRQGIDSKSLMQNVIDGKGELATSFLPKAFDKWHLPDDSSVLMKYDPEAAKRKLDAAGWTVGPGGIRQKDGKRLSLRLLIDSGEAQNTKSAEYLRPWMKAIGIDLQIKATDADTVSADSIAGNYDMYFTGWSTNPDPDYQLGINTCGNRALTTDGNGGTSQDGYCDPEFDRLFAAQRSAMDEKQRIDIVRQMQEMNYTATPQIALWYPDMLEAYRSDRFDDFGLQPSDGGIIANQAGYWGFLSARPASGSGGGGSSSYNTGVILVVAVFAAAIGGGAVYLVMRRRDLDTTE
ncbi:MAG: ABC transporter substrate-binding protein [Gordonia amarae]